MPALPVPESSEWECLNLNITAPAAILGRSHRVPVLFFLHGGGLAGGSQSIQISGREIYDPTNLVRTSVARGEPLIVVTANYRVGPLGFLASAELMADNAGGMGVSPKSGRGNYGLHDQRRALEWCAGFISGFGGDPSNVTLHGSSAGGVSGHYHCTFPPTREPLFRRAILSSGTFISCQPMPLKYHQEIFDGYVREASRLSPGPMAAKRPVDLLRSVSVGELLASTPQDVRWTMYADNIWVKPEILRAYQELPGLKPDLIIGSAEYEVCSLCSCSPWPRACQFYSPKAPLSPVTFGLSFSSVKTPSITLLYTATHCLGKKSSHVPHLCSAPTICH